MQVQDGYWHWLHKHDVKSEILIASILKYYPWRMSQAVGGGGCGGNGGGGGGGGCGDDGEAKESLI